MLVEDLVFFVPNIPFHFTLASGTNFLSPILSRQHHCGPARYQTYQKLVQGQPQFTIKSCIDGELTVYTNKKSKK